MAGATWVSVCPAPPQDNFGYELPAVEAAMKKHEAIEADIAAYEERVQGVAELAQALAAEGYHDARRVAAQRDSVLRQWALLTGLVGARRTRLEQNLALQKVFQEMVYMVDWMEEMQVGGPRGRRWAWRAGRAKEGRSHCKGCQGAGEGRREREMLTGMRRLRRRSEFMRWVGGVEE